MKYRNVCISLVFWILYSLYKDTCTCKYIPLMQKIYTTLGHEQTKLWHWVRMHQKGYADTLGWTKLLFIYFDTSGLQISYGYYQAPKSYPKFTTYKFLWAFSWFILYAFSVTEESVNYNSCLISENNKISFTKKDAIKSSTLRTLWDSNFS